MAQFSTIHQLEKRLQEVQVAFAEKGLLILSVKEIPYGVQIEAESPTGGKGKITCYFSAKKGFSATDNSKNSISSVMVHLFLGTSQEDTTSFRPSIGSDEAGKGDFFGPLITAAFFIESKEMEQELLALGIRDSKKISDAKITKMAQTIYIKWPQHYVVVAPTVEGYNNLYAKIGNLNTLLGWTHGSAILELQARCVEKNTPVEAIIIDKFADLSVVQKSNVALRALPLSAVTKGEEKEVAIAAASVMARATFIFRMDKLSQQFDMTFPFGAGDKVLVAGNTFIARYGRAKLVEVAKTHFKTILQLKG